MALRTLITERQRRLGAEVRKMREQAGLSIAEAGELIGMGRPHLSHIEAARTAVPPERLHKMAAAYGCTDEPYVDALIAMSESNGKGWWSDYRKSMPQSALDLAELESGAARLQSHETLLIPGLLQTEAYMRAVISSSLPSASPDRIESAVRYRRARQAALTAHSYASFHAVIHEAALRIAIGGSEVMRGQLAQLIEASRRPRTAIQILPFESGAHAWFGTPFLIADPGAAGLETVVVEHPAEQLCMGDDDSVRRYRTTFDGLSRSALPPIDADGSPHRHEQRDSWGIVQHILYTH